MKSSSAMIKEYMDKGDFMTRLLKQAMQESGKKRFLLDRFPRSLDNLAAYQSLIDANKSVEETFKEIEPIFLKGDRSQVLNSQNQTCNPNDLIALEGFINSLESSINSSSSDCCNWFGVVCENSRVTGIKIVRQRLRGNISESLAGLDQLKILNLSQNFLKGPLPLKLFQMQKLEVLDLSYNEFTGMIPGETSLPSLRSFDASENLLVGNISAGMLSVGIGNLSELVELDVSQNSFSGFLPDVFGSLGKLEHLTAHSNNFGGRIPASLSNSPSIRLLSLRNNSLSGSIYFNCTAMVNISSIDLGSNKLNGPLPDSLSSCRALRAINFARNNLNGQIPESFKNLQSLSYLSLSNTSIHNISAALAVLQQCGSLKTLVLTLNFQSEVMPAVADIKFENLTALVIAYCGLTGSIPQWLRNSTKLQLLDLSLNHLSGTIPNWLGGMQSLFYLDLSNNSLSGDIPSSLTKLESLIDRNISLEEPSPDIPFFLKQNQSSARVLQYNQILSFPPSLDLSYNNLTGPVWPEFGNLKKLIVFDLKSNDLSGFLSKFSVAFNKLVGRIPLEGQFSTFPVSSYEGNAGLCYEHSNACPPQQDSPNLEVPASSGKAKRNIGIIIGVAVGIGSGTLFLLAIIFFIVTRTDSWKQNDTETFNNDSFDKDLDVTGSRSVVIFEDEENNKELYIEDLLKSTGNFDQANIIGCGGFGLVYKATLPDGTKVAIKRLSGDCGQMDREFRAEVEALSRAQHENLVLLQGKKAYGYVQAKRFPEFDLMGVPNEGGEKGS
ncbi:hypothetical protein IFM89_007777 [Coptis chinensis]|uniref:Protein kinase domain-containing protein n=1 Tax=Coptis chinensis TaxID=261450 RepID=A0A835IUU1_9MAGN|nr:hypothetical protein IFM89_007777 [Coptis chinensis]